MSAFLFYMSPSLGGAGGLSHQEGFGNSCAAATASSYIRTGKRRSGCQAVALNADNFFLAEASSLAGLVEPSSHLPHDSINLVGLQEGWFLFELATPLRQDFMSGCLLWLLIRIMHNLLDRALPIVKTHRQLPSLSAWRETFIGIVSKTFRPCFLGTDLSGLDCSIGDDRGARLGDLSATTVWLALTSVTRRPLASGLYVGAVFQAAVDGVAPARPFHES